MEDDLLTTEEKSCYITNSGRLPKSSVGYWLPDEPLTLTYQHQRPCYMLEYGYSGRRSWRALHSLRWFHRTIALHSCWNSRTRLARWWKPEWADDERCYLQLSGWYT